MGQVDGGGHVRALRSVALECQEASTSTPMPEPILPALRDLIGCDSTHFVGIDNARDLVYLAQDFIPGVDFPIMSLEEENALFWEHKNSVCCQPRAPDDVPTASLRPTRGPCANGALARCTSTCSSPPAANICSSFASPTVPDEHFGCFAGEALEKPSPNGTRPIYSCSSRTLRRHTGVVNTCAQCRR